MKFCFLQGFIPKEGSWAQGVQCPGAAATVSAELTQCSTNWTACMCLTWLDLYAVTGLCH